MNAIYHRAVSDEADLSSNLIRTSSSWTERHLGDPDQNLAIALAPGAEMWSQNRIWSLLAFAYTEVDITLSADPDDCSGGSDVLWTLRDGLGDIVCRYLERQRERQYPESPR